MYANVKRQLFQMRRAAAYAKIPDRNGFHVLSVDGDTGPDAATGDRAQTPTEEDLAAKMAGTQLSAPNSSSRI